MKIKYILLSVIQLLFFASCKTLQNDMEQENSEYATKYGYKNVYIVDTLSIENPVSFVTKGGYWVMTSAEVFSELKSYGDNVLENDGVFYLYTHQEALPIEVLEHFPEGKHCFGESDIIEGTPKNIYARRYRNKIDFVLLLVKQSFYNEKLTGIDGPPRLKFKTDHLYYKILIPVFCDDSKSKE